MRRTRCEGRDAKDAMRRTRCEGRDAKDAMPKGAVLPRDAEGWAGCARRVTINEGETSVDDFRAVAAHGGERDAVFVGGGAVYV